MKKREELVNSSQPFRHAVIEGVLRLVRKLEKTSKDRCRPAVSVSSKATVRPDPPEGWMAVGNQAKAYFVVGASRLWRSEDGSDDVVVKERRSSSDLSFFQSKDSVMVPGCLSENREGKWMYAKYVFVSCLRLINVR